MFTGYGVAAGLEIAGGCGLVWLLCLWARKRAGL